MYSMALLHTSGADLPISMVNESRRRALLVTVALQLKRNSVTGCELPGGQAVAMCNS